MKKEFPTHPGRTRFGDIVCEYTAPLRKSNKVLVLASGMPGYPGGSGKAIRSLAERGYWVFVPRYAGSWESRGKFLAHSPHEDVLTVVHGVSEEFMDIWSGKTLRIAKPRVYVIGASFGGAAAILAARDKAVVKAIALSPVVDWRGQEKTTEPVDLMAHFVHEAFGEAYRGDVSVWKKLAGGKFYSPVHELSQCGTYEVPHWGKKLMIIHAKDDDVVPHDAAKQFAETVGAQFVSLRTGGHFGVSNVLKPRLYRRADAFLKHG